MKEGVFRYYNEKNMGQMINAIFDQEFILMSSRIIIALVLSGLIGFEREMNKHSAGFRTHILVGVSSCSMMLLSLYGFTEYLDNYGDAVRFDPARVPSYVISGIGFLGAGTIIVNGMTVRGLTTAASIWAVAGLGLVVGAGMYKVAVLSTIIILLSLIFLNNFERILAKNAQRSIFQISIRSIMDIEKLFVKLNQFDLKIKQVEINNDNEFDPVIQLKIEIGKSTNKATLYHQILDIEEVKQVKEL
ncbi:putative Mg2+ transporter-C (MgtC) family protein [Natronobacillus azotifigens]